jgi:Ca2+-binding RTX toxin-like protein
MDFHGGPENDTATHGYRNLYGNDGNDTLGGDQPGANLVSGGAGNDTVFVWGNPKAYTVRMYGGEGNDVCYGHLLNDTIVGGYGNDIVAGSAFLVTQSGQLIQNERTDPVSGNDTLWGSYGIDRIYGFDGADKLYGGDQTDYVYGGTGNDPWINGTAGNDFVYGGPGKDNVYGDVGNDVLYGGPGADLLDGGNGIDTVSYADSTSRVTVDMRLGKTPQHATSGNGAAGDRVEQFENLVGSPGSDHLTGDQRGNTIKGLGGNDIISGWRGHDLLYGGPGRDTFNFDYIFESPAGKGRDVIADFSRASHDRIDLSTIDANTQVDGNQRFTYIGNHAFHHKAGELHYINHNLSGDVNGDGHPDFNIHVNVAALSAAAGDILL